jgi:hypothetical protein
MQSTTPGFVLTSLSLCQTENKKTTQNLWQQTNIEKHSNIAKFDYCLPPDEFNIAEQADNRHPG